MPAATTVKKETVKVSAKPAEEAPAAPSKQSRAFYVPTEHTKGFQELVGGVPVGTITGFLGAPEACKTVLSTQVAVEVAVVQEGNVLVFDTENKFHQHLGLASGFSQRFGRDISLVRVKADLRKTGQGENAKTIIDWELEDEIDPKALNIFLVHCPSLIKLTAMFGAGLDLKVFDSGKFKVMLDGGAWTPDITNSPVAKFIQKHNVKSLVVDSFTNPLDIIPAVGENFPARADATQNWMIQMHSLAAEYGLPVLVTFHESKNDTNPFSKQLKYEGGKGVGYNLPFIIYLLKVNEPGLLPKAATKPRQIKSNERAMYVARHGSNTIRPWTGVQYLTVGETGLSDSDGDDSDDSNED